MDNKKYYPTAIALYLLYFVHGIGVSILGQYKQSFAGTWGAKQLADGKFDVSVVLAVIAALGLGRLITLPISGPLSDRFGRRLSGLIGIALYGAYFFGIATAPSMGVAYAFALAGGAANSFLDTCVSPTVLEIFTKRGDVANMITKFSISIGQLLLPFMIGFVAANSMSYKTIFFVTGAFIVIDGILIAFMPFPPKNAVASSADNAAAQTKEKMKFTPVSIAVISLGFTITATFQLWLNCNQELGKLYGLTNPAKIQSLYATGTMTAIIVSSVLLRYIKAVRIIFLYPAISLVMLIIIYFVQTPGIVLVGGFVLGFAAAGGVLQLAVSTANSFFPTNKGKVTSMVMITSSIANYTILNLAGAITKASGVNGPKNVILLNIAVTVVGVLIAVYVNAHYEQEAKLRGLVLATN